MLNKGGKTENCTLKQFIEEKFLTTRDGHPTTPHLYKVSFKNFKSNPKSNLIHLSNLVTIENLIIKKS